MQKQISVEGVNYQPHRLFFEELTDIIDEVRHGREEFVKIGEVICNHIGLEKLFVIIEHTDKRDASIRTPVIDSSHPFHAFINKEYKHDSHDKIKKAFSNTPSAVGWVDREKCYIGGVFQSFRPMLFITEGVLFNKKLKAEHVAAIILHEIGHLFSYYETLATLIVTNRAITDAMEEMIGEKDNVIKSRIVNNLIKQDVLPETIDPETVSQLDDEHLRELLITTSMRENVFRNDSPMYDITACEQQADAFVVRLNAGKELSEALTILGVLDRDFDRVPPLMVELFCFVAKSAIFLGPLYWLTSWSLHMDKIKNDRYDTPSDRFKRIKREMIGGLKKQSDEKEIKKWIKEIEEVEKIIEAIPDTRTRLEKFWSWITPFIRRQTSKKEQQQAIESLLNNDLTVTALKIQTQGK